jgi:hypothetical protein
VRAGKGQLVLDRRLVELCTTCASAPSLEGPTLLGLDHLPYRCNSGEVPGPRIGGEGEQAAAGAREAGDELISVNADIDGNSHI